MQGGKAPSEDAVKYERLVAELAAGVKMTEFGLPAKMSAENLPLVEYWTKELHENPILLEAIETDVNNAVEVMRKAERGEKIEYAALRDHKRTTELREKQKPQVDSRESAIRSTSSVREAWAWTAAISLSRRETGLHGKV